MAAWTDAVGLLFPSEAQSHDGVWPTLFDMDWNLFLRVIFINFAVKAGTHCVGVTWDVFYIRSILERHDLETVQNFCARFWSWVVQSPLALHTVVGGHSDEHLKALCRPGAWLLDSVYTEVLVIVGQRSPDIVYEAVGNRSLQTWATLIIGPGVADTVRGRNRNYVGNIMEHLAWLAFEDNRHELIVAFAFMLAYSRS